MTHIGAASFRRCFIHNPIRYLNKINIIPLTGTKSRTHLKENLAIINFELTADEYEVVGK
jgi:diketogulonate reductase-like aldo/keto reductase